MPTHWLLSAAEYFDQFCLSVSWAAVSSARQASLLRPSITAPRPAASQLVSTLSLGGPPPERTCALFAPIPTPRASPTHAILAARTNMANLVPDRLGLRSWHRGLPMVGQVGPPTS